MITALALDPGQKDLLRLVDEHNRANPTHIHLLFDYEASQSRARAGIVFSF